VSFPPIRVVDLDLAGDGYGTMYALSFPYDRELVAILKGAIYDARKGRSRPAGSWQPKDRCWWVEEFAWDEVSDCLRAAGCTLVGPDGQALAEPKEEKPPFKLSSFPGLP
jgi:hypothetical protein